MCGIYVVHRNIDRARRLPNEGPDNMAEPEAGTTKDSAEKAYAAATEISVAKPEIATSAPVEFPAKANRPTAPKPARVASAPPVPVADAIMPVIAPLVDIPAAKGIAAKPVDLPPELEADLAPPGPKR